jgi:hypothetical protein
MNAQLKHKHGECVAACIVVDMFNDYTPSADEDPTGWTAKIRKSAWDLGPHSRYAVAVMKNDKKRYPIMVAAYLEAVLLYLYETIPPGPFRYVTGAVSPEDAGYIDAFMREFYLRSGSMH